MKIAVFTETYPPQTNGVAIYVAATVHRLAKKHEVVLFTPGAGKRLEMTKPEPNLKIYAIPRMMPFPFYKGYDVASPNYRRISELLKKEEPDIVHAHIPVWLGVQGVISAKRKKIPLVITYHTHLPEYTSHLGVPGALKKLSEFAVKKIINHTYKMADVVTTPTEELKTELASYGLKNVVCLPNGIDTKRLVFSKERLIGLKRKFGLENKEVVLYLGRLSVEKKVSNLLDSYRKIEKDGRILVIAGGGPELEGLKSYAKKIGLMRVVFTGLLDEADLGAMYSCADVFVSPSDTETFGLTMVEAMYFGVPVVGMNRLGHKDIVKNNKNGYLVEPGDMSGMAQAIERILGDKTLRDAMSQEARITAAGFDIEKTVEKTEKLYLELTQNAINRGNSQKR